MATYTWDVNVNSVWTDVGANVLVFSGSSTDLSVAVNVDAYNTGLHLGNGYPGQDQCNSTAHLPCITYVSDTVFSMDGGNTTATFSSTAFTSTMASFRIAFTDEAAVEITAGRVFCFNSVVDTTPAEGVHAYAVEQGVSSSFKLINDQSASIGGDLVTHYLALSTHAASTIHHYYIGMSVQPESSGLKSRFDIGVALVYS